MIGDDPEKLSGAIELNPQPEEDDDAPRWRWPAILMGAAAVSALGVGAVLLLGHHSAASAPPPLQIAVARTVPPPPAPTPEPMLTPPPPAEPPAQSAPADEPKDEAVAPAEAQPTAEPAAKKSEPKKLIGKPAHKGKKIIKRLKASAVPRDVIEGEKLLKQKRYGAALEQFQHTLRDSPDDVRALRGACAALDELGRKNDAARVCRRALTLEPEDVETRATLARIYYTGGAYQWSANEWRRVLTARPADANAKKGLRAALARL
jgi:tetratricopeptide (TPR) repeat protein